MANIPGFKTKKAVHNYLVGIGYDMGVSELSSKLAECLKDIKKKGGMWLQADIDTYAPIWGFKMMEGAMSADASVLDLQIKKAELRTREGTADKVERENAKIAGQLIDRSKVNRELVARMIQLRKDEKTDNKVKAAEMISIFGGDLEKEKDLKNYLDAATDRRMNTYAKPFKFSVTMSELEKEIALLEAAEGN